MKKRCGAPNGSTSRARRAWAALRHSPGRQRLLDKGGGEDWEGGHGVATPSPTAGPAGPHAPHTRPSWESAWNCWESPSLGRLGPGVTNSLPEVPPPEKCVHGGGGRRPAWGPGLSSA